MHHNALSEKYSMIILSHSKHYCINYKLYTYNFTIVFIFLKIFKFKFKNIFK